MKQANFYSGPAILPPEILEQAGKGIIEIKGSGLSIAEISHRSSIFTDILQELKSLITEHLELPSSHEVLIVQGGGRLQFAQIPMNFLNGQTAGFVDTGYWAHMAMEYAAYYGNTVQICGSEATGYTSLPLLPTQVDENLAYVQLTSNNTIFGTQFKKLPDWKVPLVVDMSSDIMSRRRNFSRISLAFACAQKNIGPAGMSIVVADRTFLEKASKAVPPVLSYKNLADSGSNYATPPVVNVYMALLMMRWMKEKGGISAIEQANKQKAELLYNAIDHSRVFSCQVPLEDRSEMNCCFRTTNRDSDRAFIEFCKQRQVIGIEGHVSRGGLRASLYNAQTFENVQKLVEVMHDFEEEYPLP